MRQEETTVIQLFSEDISRELTIREISKLIKKSYFYTNTLVHSMVKEGILLKKIFGHSIVCSLNKESDVALSLLCLNSAIEKQRFLDKRKDKEKIISKIDEIDDSEIVVYYKDVKVAKRASKGDIVLKNFESYWRKMLKQ